MELRRRLNDVYAVLTIEVSTNGKKRKKVLKHETKSVMHDKVGKNLLL